MKVWSAVFFCFDCIKEACLKRERKEIRRDNYAVLTLLFLSFAQFLSGLKLDKN